MVRFAGGTNNHLVNSLTRSQARFINFLTNQFFQDALHRIIKARVVTRRFILHLVILLPPAGVNLLEIDVSNASSSSALGADKPDLSTFVDIPPVHPPRTASLVQNIIVSRVFVFLQRLNHAIPLGQDCRYVNVRSQLSLVLMSDGLLPLSFFSPVGFYLRST